MDRNKNKNVLILSDAHGRDSYLDDIFDEYNACSSAGRIEDVIFLGDGCRGMIDRVPSDIRLFAVRGNCDSAHLIDREGEPIPEERIEFIGGKKLLLTHGHAYGVKGGLGRAIKRAAELGADILLFGHTHQPSSIYLPADDESYGIRLERPLYIFNPGALLSGSFGTLTIVGESLILSHGRL